MAMKLKESEEGILLKQIRDNLGELAELWDPTPFDDPKKDTTAIPNTLLKETSRLWRELSRFE